MTHSIYIVHTNPEARKRMAKKKAEQKKDLGNGFLDELDRGVQGMVDEFGTIDFCTDKVTQVKLRHKDWASIATEISRFHSLLGDAFNAAADDDWENFNEYIVAVFICISIFCNSSGINMKGEIRDLITRCKARDASEKILNGDHQ